MVGAAAREGGSCWPAGAGVITTWVSSVTAGQRAVEPADPPGARESGPEAVPVWHAQQATLPERRIALTPSAARRRHPPSRSDLRWPLMVRQVRCGLRTLVNAVENSIREAGLADGVPARHRNLAGEQDPWEPRCLLLAFRALTGFRRRPSNQ